MFELFRIPHDHVRAEGALPAPSPPDFSPHPWSTRHGMWVYGYPRTYVQAPSTLMQMAFFEQQAHKQLGPSWGG